MMLTVAAGMAAATTPVLADPPEDAASAGESLYARHCLVCHQADGSGVPNMQPALRDSLIVTGDPGVAILWVLMGTPPGADTGLSLWANAMPGFTHLSDAEIAAIVTYMRRDLSHEEPVHDAAVTPAQVAAERGALDF